MRNALISAVLLSSGIVLASSTALAERAKTTLSDATYCRLTH
ncbi:MULTISPECIES: hypothetical protein [unclassified Shewanella]|nr:MULTISPECIES: hypothetical protein [unclassified Shewanella]